MLVLVVLLAGLAVDRFLAPPAYVAVGPFALALVLAGRRYDSRGIVLACAGIAALFIGVAAATSVPWPIGLTDCVALGLIGYTAYLSAHARSEVSTDHRRLASEHENLLRFLAAVAHDMRQPLTSIGGYAQYLQRSGSHDINEYRALEAISNATHRLERLTGDLSDASAVGSGHFALKTGPVDLMQLLRQVGQEYQALTNRHTLYLDGPERLIGIWDGDRLRQLFGNLIGNAIKYSPDGGDVRIDVYHAAGALAVTVSDQGIGIDGDQQRFLFQPFSRLRVGRADGSGLGLYISQGIAYAHGGLVSVESEPGGSTFRVSLPLVSGPVRRRAPRPHRRRYPVPVRRPFLPEPAEQDQAPLPAATAAAPSGRRPEETGVRDQAS